MRDGRELQGLDPRGHRADRARRELTRLATRDTVIWLLNRGAFLASAQEVFTRRPSTTYRRAVEASRRSRERCDGQGPAVGDRSATDERRTMHDFGS